MHRGRLRPLLGTRQLRYVAAGLLAMVTDYGTFFVTYGIFGLDLAVATVASYLVSFAVSFSANKLWVFESRGTSLSRSAQQALFYALLLVVNIGFTYYFLLGLREWLAVDPRISKLIAIGMVAAWNYALYSRAIFSPRGA